MQKIILPVLFYLFLASCGYEAIYSKKNSMNYNFSISELNFIGDREVNLRIKQRLNNYTLNQSNKDFKVKIYSTSTKVISAKNTSGDATSFRNTVTTSVEVSMNGKFKNSFIIDESFNYNIINNKFSLKKYEREIKNNLAQTVTDKIIFKLSNIQ
jgi:hypothetical protein